MPAKKDIFISYRNDGIGNNFATRITSDLKNSGYSVYFNPDEARSGDFPERLREAISESKDFVCIVTQDYLEHLIANPKVCWIREELMYARQYRKNIVPILVNGARMPSDISVFPENLRFFPNIDAYVFPEQYIHSPYHTLCEVLISRNDGKNDFRDSYNLSDEFDVDQSLSSILEMAKNGDEKAMLQAGIYYYYGLSQGKDERKAAQWFKKVSFVEGEYAAIANRFLARMYYAGSIPREPQSYEKSYEYHCRAAETDSYSAGEVGYMMSIGSGCDYNYAQTDSYYQSILNQLDHPHKDSVCKFYIEHGEYLKAAEIYQNIADTYPNAAYQLGLLYRRGVLETPFRPDYNSAAMYFQKALDSGFIDAAFQLGLLYFNPCGNFSKDFGKAQKYFEISAEYGDSGAQYMLGFMYYYGHVEKNIPLAIEYFEMAAKQGHMLSVSNLALLYQIPEYHNYEKAFQYCKLAADCGDITSEFVLGTLYLEGRGCETDADKAYLCFRHAADKGSSEALIMLEKMDEMGL